MAFFVGKVAILSVDIISRYGIIFISITLLMD